MGHFCAPVNMNNTLYAADLHHLGMCAIMGTPPQGNRVADTKVIVTGMSS